MATVGEWIWGGLLLGFTMLVGAAKQRAAIKAKLARENTAVDPSRMPNGKHTISGALDIAYTDGAGSTSERYIEARSLEVRGRLLYLWGWCEQRQAMRSFRVDRIQQMSDGETGEIVDASHIQDWLTDRAGVARILRS